MANGAVDPLVRWAEAAAQQGRAAAAESACARPDVWRADALSAAPARVCATGHAALDAVLPGGGWPLGALVELLQQAPAQAVWRLLAPALATLDGAVVLVGAPLPPFAPALEAQGLAAQRLLWVCADTAAERAWAAEQALACAEVGAVLLWLHEAPPSVRPPIATAESAAGPLAARRNPRPRSAARAGTGEAPSPSLLLRRLHLAAQGRGKLLVALRPEAARHTPSCAVLRLALQEDEAAAKVSPAPAPAPAPAPTAPAKPVPVTASVRASGSPSASAAGHRPGRAATGPAGGGPAAAACAEGPGLRVQVLKRRGPPLEAPLHLPRHGTALQALLAAQQTYRARLRSGWDAVPRPAPPAAAPVSLRPARSPTAVVQPAALAVGAPE